MAVFLTRLKVGHPAPILTVPEDWPGCWKIYTICATENVNSCQTRADVNVLEKSDKKDARSSFHHFVNNANTGRPLQELYDEKQCHEAHTFMMDGHQEKILRIWGSGDIRMYFCYLPGQIIVLLKTRPKRTDKLSKGEKLELEAIARQVLEAVNTDTLRMI